MKRNRVSNPDDDGCFLRPESVSMNGRREFQKDLFGTFPPFPFAAEKGRRGKTRPLQDSNLQPSDPKSDALPLRQEANNIPSERLLALEKVPHAVICVRSDVGRLAQWQCTGLVNQGSRVQFSEWPHAFSMMVCPSRTQTPTPGYAHEARWSSGPRRHVQVVISPGGVGSNPTLVTLFLRTSLHPLIIIISL